MSPGEGEKFNPQNLLDDFPYAAAPVDDDGRPIPASDTSSDAANADGAETTAPTSVAADSSQDSRSMAMWLALPAAAGLMGGGYAIRRRRKP